MAHTYVIYGLIRPHIEALFIINLLAIHNGMGTYVLLWSTTTGTAVGQTFSAVLYTTL